MDWIESDLSHAMTSSEVGERAGYTRWHLQRLFKQVTGYSLVGYIRARRMTVAAELLKTTTLSIADIYVRLDIIAELLFAMHLSNISAFRDSTDDFSTKMIRSLRCL
ncbi:helix-turn-helix domain-containing protein (plasmid) [Klebsiella aerogenes]|nr:helix-turn-helix domain-containing protein [Klebsiella aerogenes]